MRFWGITRFELAYQARRLWPWLCFAVLTVLAYLLARDNSLAEALHDEFFVNSPFAIAKTTVVGTVFWLLLAPPIAGDAAARDESTGMYPLAYTLPVSRRAYLGGRFLAAFLIDAVLLLAVQLGMLLAIYLPGVPPALIGPFRPAAFLTAYGYIALPTAFVAVALQFALAQRSGRAMSSYAGSVLLMFVTIFIASLLLFRRSLGRLLDPVGMRFILEDLSHQWTTIEKSHRLLALEGALLTNRLIWIGVGVGVLATLYARFRFEHRVERGMLSRLRAAGSGLRASAHGMHSPAEHAPPARVVARSARPAARRFGFAASLRQTLAIAVSSLRYLLSSWPGRAFLTCIPLVTILVVLDQLGAMGTPLVPRTALVLRELVGGLTASLAAEPSRWVIVPLGIVFFAGELVWRERDAGLGDITDAMPGSDWVPLAGKILGLGLFVALFLTLVATAGIVAQIIRGHRELELGLYAQVLLGLQLPEHLLFAVLAVMIHVVVDSKYVGHLVAVLAYMFTAALAGLVGIEHPMLLFGRGAGWTYTEMRGFGGSLGAWGWFKLYWAAWALLLAVITRLLWGRGRERGLRTRLAGVRVRLARPTAIVAGVAVALVLATGGFVFWNVNVLHAYRSRDAVSERRAEYERRYRRFEHAPQPRLAATRLRVEIHPERHAVEVRGTHRLVNETGVAIDSIHVVTSAGDVETLSLGFDRGARLVLDDRAHGYRVYRLATPLRPGDAVAATFEVRHVARGFHQAGADRAITPNGSSFTGEWLPTIGYQRSRELLTAAARREHGLPPRPILGALYDVEGAEPATRGGGVLFEAVVGTRMGEVPVAPGAPRRTWTEHGRTYIEYATSDPIGTEWAFLSAPYRVHEETWTPPAHAISSRTVAARPVTVRIYHHPRHGEHVGRTMRAVRAAMDFYGTDYGPYPYTHLTIAERPGAPGYSAHADASVITHGESFGYWTPRAGRPDMPTFVMAHELGHEWGMPYAVVEGLPFMAEGLATYQAMRMVATTQGDVASRRLLAFLRLPFPYPPIKRGEPLLRALDPHMARRWGPFALWTMGTLMGFDRVDGAIRRLIARSDSSGTAVTTLDLYRELQAVTPDPLRPLLADLFETKTYRHLETRRVRADSLGGDRWRVTLDVRARRVTYDSAGAATERPMDELVPIGVFARGPRGDELGAPLHLAAHRVRSGDQTIVVEVRGRPVLAGIDPHHLLDWEEGEDDDNVEGVVVP